MSCLGVFFCCCFLSLLILVFKFFMLISDKFIVDTYFHRDLFGLLSHPDIKRSSSRYY